MGVAHHSQVLRASVLDLGDQEPFDLQGWESPLHKRQEPLHIGRMHRDVFIEHRPAGVLHIVELHRVALLSEPNRQLGLAESRFGEPPGALDERA